MSGETRAFFFFHQITGKEESGVNRSRAAGLVLWYGVWPESVRSKLFVVVLGCEFDWIGRLVLYSCPNATRDDLLPRSLVADSLFWTFVDHFIVTFWVESAPKNLEEESCWLIEKKKKDLFNCKYNVTFQPDGCTGPTSTATCFIHFGFGHRLENIRLLICTFVVFYLFVYLLILLVSWFAMF